MELRGKFGGEFTAQLTYTNDMLLQVIKDYIDGLDDSILKHITMGTVENKKSQKSVMIVLDLDAPYCADEATSYQTGDVIDIEFTYG